MTRPSPDSVPVSIGTGEPIRVQARRKAPQHARPRIQRAFLHWLEEARPRLKRPITISRRTDRVIEFTFDVGGSALVGWLNRYEVEVGAFLGGECWDLVYSNWVDVERSERGYYCGACSQENQMSYETRDDLWIQHLFEPFLQWVNTTLASARELRFYKIHDGGVTWAKIANGSLGKGDDSTAVVMLH